VDFSPDPAQEAVADVVASVLARDNSWQALVDGGVTALGVPERLGGDGVGLPELATALTEIGRHGTIGPALATLGLGLLPLLDLALLCWVVRVSYARFIDRLGDRRWIAWACLVAICGFTAPVLSVFDLGQLGLVLMALVLADTLRTSRLPRRVLVGLATAIKVLPGVFVLYWAVTRRWRAALVASATAVGLWVVTALVHPGISSTYWFHEAIHTDRAGDAADVFNQSLNGTLQRIGWTSTAVWAVAATAVLVVGLRRAREAHLAGDELAAVALVGLAGVLASPISWVHHAVWIVPVSGVLLGDGRARRRWIAWGATMLLFLADVPLWGRAGVPVGVFHVLTENAFVIAFVVLLVLLPIDHDPARAEEPDRDAAPVAATT